MIWLIFTICLFLLLIFLIKKFFFTRQYILLTGSASSEYVKTFLNDKYKITYEPTTIEYKLNSSTKLIVSCDLNKAAFDLKSFELKYNEIKSGLKQIVCIENLNPRPETLDADLNVLSKVFSSLELRNYLNIVFKSSSQRDLDLSEIRKSSASFNVLFNALGLKYKTEIDKYIAKQIWTEATFKADRFKGMHGFFKILIVALISYGCIFGLLPHLGEMDKFQFLNVYGRVDNLTFEYFYAKEKSTSRKKIEIESSVFSKPDVIVEFDSENEIVIIEAFEKESNDEILKSNLTSRFGQLHWFSLGNPVLTRRNKTDLFQFYPDGFYTFVDLLTGYQKKLIKEKIKSQYKIEVENGQITNFILTQFVCELNLECGETKLRIEGEVEYFDKFPLKLSFKLDKKLKAFKECIEDELRNNTENLELKCQAAKYSRFNQTFTKNFTVKPIDEAKYCAYDELVCGWEMNQKPFCSKTPDSNYLYRCERSKSSFELVENCVVIRRHC